MTISEIDNLDEICKEVEKSFIPMYIQLQTKVETFETDILSKPETLYSLNSEAQRIIELIKSACRDLVFDTESGEADWDMLEVLREKYGIFIVRAEGFDPVIWEKAKIKTPVGSIIFSVNHNIREEL